MSDAYGDWDINRWYEERREYYRSMIELKIAGLLEAGAFESKFAFVDINEKNMP